MVAKEPFQIRPITQKIIFCKNRVKVKNFTKFASSSSESVIFPRNEEDLKNWHTQGFGQVQARFWSPKFGQVANSLTLNAFIFA